MNAKKILVILLGVFLVAGGVYCLFTPLETFLSTGYVVGALIFCDAIANIIAWFDVRKYTEISGWYLFAAIVSVVFGIAVMVSPLMQLSVDMVILYMICFWIIFAAVARIMIGVRVKKVYDTLPNEFKNGRWIWLIIAGVLMIVFAGICMAKPAVLSTILGVFIALYIIFNGISLITLGTYIQTSSN